MSESQTSGLILYIEKVVRKYWENSRKPLLLSALGMKIRMDNVAPNEMIRGKLRQLVEKSPALRIVKHSAQDQKIGVIPADIALPENPDELFESVSTSSFPRILPEFWRAFYSPLAGRRFVVIGDDEKISVVDSISEPAAATFFEIRQEDLVAADTPQSERAQATVTAIKKWVANKNLKLNAFSFENRKPPESRRLTSEATVDLARAIEALSDSDLSKISVPLDVVKKMILQMRR